MSTTAQIVEEVTSILTSPSRLWTEITLVDAVVEEDDEFTVRWRYLTEATVYARRFSARELTSAFEPSDARALAQSVVATEVAGPPGTGVWRDGTCWLP